MATKTALTHKNRAAQLGQFYPYALQVNGFDADGEATVLFESPAAYQPATGQNPDDFADESPSSDRVLLPTWRAECEPKQTVILSLGDFAKRFEISDVLPEGDGPSKTLLIVTPEQG